MAQKRIIGKEVEAILKDYPETRSDDRLLLAYYWYLVDEVNFNSFEGFIDTFKKSTGAETITRVRRHIQYGDHDGERYLPDGEVTRARRSRAVEFANEYTTDLR